MFEKKRNLVVDEKDLITMLKVINDNRRANDFSAIVNDDDSTKWYVDFLATEKQWRNICKQLKEIGNLGVDIDDDGLTTLLFNGVVEGA